MSTEKDKAPERLWVTPAEASWRAYPLDEQRAFPASAPEQIEYVRADLLAQVEQERDRLKEAVSEISIKKYDEWAFGQCQGLAKRALEKL